MPELGPCAVGRVPFPELGPCTVGRVPGRLSLGEIGLGAGGRVFGRGVITEPFSNGIFVPGRLSLGEIGLGGGVWRELLPELWLGGVWRELLSEFDLDGDVWRELFSELDLDGDVWRELLSELGRAD